MTSKKNGYNGRPRMIRSRHEIVEAVTEEMLRQNPLMSFNDVGELALLKLYSGISEECRELFEAKWRLFRPSLPQGFKLVKSED